MTGPFGLNLKGLWNLWLSKPSLTVCEIKENSDGVWLRLSSRGESKKCLSLVEWCNLSKSSWVSESSGLPGVGQNVSPLLNNWIWSIVSLCEDKFTINLLGCLCLSETGIGVVWSAFKMGRPRGCVPLLVISSGAVVTYGCYGSDKMR